MYTTKEIRGKNAILAVNKKAFFSIYALAILQVILLVVSTYSMCIKNEISMISASYDLHYCELYAINKAKTDLIKYEEEDLTLSYLDYAIDFVYEDITVYITIRKGERIYLKSCLQWDDIDDCVRSYTYLDEYDPY